MHSTIGEGMGLGVLDFFIFYHGGTWQLYRREEL
jgi:hypothetical protein